MNYAPLFFLAYAKRTNELLNLFYACMKTETPTSCLCGWWYEDNKQKKVISLDGGALTIKVDASIDTSCLPEVEPNRKYETQEEEFEYLKKRINHD